MPRADNGKMTLSITRETVLNPDERGRILPPQPWIVPSLPVGSVADCDLTAFPEALSAVARAKSEVFSAEVPPYFLR